MLLSSPFFSHRRLTWLVNTDPGGSVPTVFFKKALVNMMFFPRAKIIEIEQGLTVSLASNSGQDGNSRTRSRLRSRKRHGLDTTDQGTTDDKDKKGAVLSVDELVRGLSMKDCLVADFKDKTIEQQRDFFRKEMVEMAREGHDDVDGWTVSRWGARRCGTSSPSRQDTWLSTVQEPDHGQRHRPGRPARRVREGGRLVCCQAAALSLGDDRLLVRRRLRLPCDHR